MSTRSCLLALCTSIVALGSFSATRSQAVEAPNCSSGAIAAPRASTDPAQPAQGLSSNAWGKIMRQVRASRYDLLRRVGPGGDAGDAHSAVWVATHPNLNLTYEFGARGMRVQPRDAAQDAWSWGLELVGFGGEGGSQSVGPVSPHVVGNR
ncbi:MAG: hypothetical protein O7D35_06175, partial [Acidobacteria bacterium]|nr:hypothetical protein [Acidobacteriota bacterium]